MNSMSCKTCNKNKPKVASSIPTKQNIKELIEKIKKERIKKDNDNGN
jgi:hypothetical protein